MAQQKRDTPVATAVAATPAGRLNTFEKSLIARGEAAIPRADGSLKPGATHEIRLTPDGAIDRIVRKRFAAV
jgi:hypothetical protein